MALVLVSATFITSAGAGDVPPLTIDPTEGSPGDSIAGQGDTALVDANCFTDTDERKGSHAEW